MLDLPRGRLALVLIVLFVRHAPPAYGAHEPMALRASAHEIQEAPQDARPVGP